MIFGTHGTRKLIMEIQANLEFNSLIDILFYFFLINYSNVTTSARNGHQIPEHNVVAYWHKMKVFYCLDTSRYSP